MADRELATLPAWFETPADDGRLPILKSRDIKMVRRMERMATLPDNDRPWYDKMIITVCGEQWQLDRLLGSGAFGQVYLSTHVPSGSRYALKFLSGIHDKEVEFLKSVPARVWRHDNLVTYYGLATDLEPMATRLARAKHIIFMEATCNGDLLDLLRAPGSVKGMAEGTMRRLVHDVTDGLDALRREGITHRDLKPENLLLDDCGRLILCDLGHAKFWGKRHDDDDEARASSPCRGHADYVGTDEYRAPEGLTSTLCDSEKADVFVLGIVAFLLRVPQPPFHSAGGLGVVEEEGPSERWWQRFPQIGTGLKAMLNTLWRRDPARRPSLSELKLARRGDERVLESFPGLRWLCEGLSTPLEFVQELRLRRPNLTLRRKGGAEALALFVRRYATQGLDLDDVVMQAFAEADLNDGLATEELAAQLFGAPRGTA